MTRDQALQQLQAWTTNPSLLTHARSVEIVMRAAAAKHGGDPDVWAVTGLLHDADYDQWPEDHPQRIVDWLREQGEEEIAYAVSFHQTKWNLPPKAMMDKCLLACDELTGFIIACCLVRRAASEPYKRSAATFTPRPIPSQWPTQRVLRARRQLPSGPRCRDGFGCL
jgi:predicted hydrolase (HD superfamily)